MTRENFISIVKSYYEITKHIFDLGRIGFNLIDNSKYPISGLVSDMFVEILRTEYNTEGLDWVDWYIHEYNFSIVDDKETTDWMYPQKEPAAWDEYKNPICFNIDVLYDYINEHCKIDSK